MDIEDHKITITVIYFIGSGFVVGMCGLFALALRNAAVPEGLTTIVGGLAGALGALLATTRTHHIGNEITTDITDGAGAGAGAGAGTAKIDITELAATAGSSLPHDQAGN